jgi:hypothetical protein
MERTIPVSAAKADLPQGTQGKSHSGETAIPLRTAKAASRRENLNLGERTVPVKAVKAN